LDPKSSGTGTAPVSPADAATIRETLDRVLASQAFRKSEQCQKFLRYVVEHRGEPLKERSIGVEVFGRHSDYDTSEDPVVRVRATEVRKRLSQYYGESSDPRDVRFEIPAGAYQVEFQSPAAPPLPAALRRRRTDRRWLAIPALIVLAATLWIARRPDVLDRFWAPAVDSPNPVLIYCGQPVVYFLSRDVHEKYRSADRPRGTYPLAIDPDATIRGRDIIPVTGQFVGIGNSHTAAMLAVLLAGRRKPVEIRYADDLSFGDLRSSPSVLVGAFSNLYALEMQDRLRFVFEQDGGMRRIRDRNDNRTWQLASLAPDGKTPEDYALVSRLFDSGTGQLLITAAGITQYGTRSAGEFLTSPALLQKALAAAPRDWPRRNLQVLLHTTIYRGSPGTPEIVASHVW
jgi:hypothetical protein